VNFKILSKSAEEKTVKLTSNTTTFPITFDKTATGAKCGYYDTATKKWVTEGTLTDKTCAFTHLTNFAIFTEGSGTKTGSSSGYMVTLFSIYYSLASSHGYASIIHHCLVLITISYFFISFKFKINIFNSFLIY